jgi:hypothetical protein
MRCCHIRFAGTLRGKRTTDDALVFMRQRHSHVSCVGGEASHRVSRPHVAGVRGGVSPVGFLRMGPPPAVPLPCERAEYGAILSRGWIARSVVAPNVTPRRRDLGLPMHDIPSLNRALPTCQPCPVSLGSVKVPENQQCKRTINCSCTSATPVPTGTSVVQLELLDMRMLMCWYASDSQHE